MKLIRRSRELLDDYYDELPRGRTPAEQAFARAVENADQTLTLVKQAVRERSYLRSNGLLTPRPAMTKADVGIFSVA